jgi:predicted Zn-dependent protease
MNKIIFQGVFIVLTFFGTWFILREISWIDMLHIDNAYDTTEKQIGDQVLAYILKNEKELHNPFIKASLDSVITHICEANELDRETFNLIILEKDEINAFALPNGNILVYSGLIKHVENQNALTGILCHEIAHVTQHHVMKNLIKEFGLATLFSISTGQDGTIILREVTKKLSSSNFERGLEKEADLKAVQYLLHSDVDPEPFANFLYNLSLQEKNTQLLSWIQSHPVSKTRAKYIIAASDSKKKKFKSILSDPTWKRIQINLSSKESE